MDSNQEYVICRNCGSFEPSKQIFCASCKAPLQATESQSKNYTVAKNLVFPPFFNDKNLFASLIGKNSDYYLKYLNTRREKEIRALSKFSPFTFMNYDASWNWAAFLFSFNWFLYRKMYGSFLIFSLIFFVGFLFSFYYFLPIYLIVCVYLGLFGNYIYTKQIKTLEKRASKLQEPNKSKFIKKSGGVNEFAVVLFAPFQILLTVLIILFRTLM